LAALVVKDFVLPMFDNDGKKLLKKKGKVSLNNSKVNINRDDLSNPTVFEELKLSQMLQEEIKTLREAYNCEKERSEELGQKLYSISKQIPPLKHKLK
jgi:hypothetical protein